MRLRLEQGAGGAWEIAEASLAFGGVAPVTIMAPATAAALAGRPLDGATLEAALAALRQDVRISDDAPGGCALGGGVPCCAVLCLVLGWAGPGLWPLFLRAHSSALASPVRHLPSLAGGMPEFRRSLAASFLFKALLHAAQALEADAPGFASPFPPSYRSGEPPAGACFAGRPAPCSVPRWACDQLWRACAGRPAPLCPTLTSLAPASARGLTSPCACSACRSGPALQPAAVARAAVLL